MDRIGADAFGDIYVEISIDDLLMAYKVAQLEVNNMADFFVGTLELQAVALAPVGLIPEWRFPTAEEEDSYQEESFTVYYMKESVLDSLEANGYKVIAKPSIN